MAGSDPAEAVERYLDRLNQAVHCICHANIVADLWAPASKRLPYGTAFLREGGAPCASPAIALTPSSDQFQPLYLLVQQNYRPIEITGDAQRGPWKVQTLGYRYKITDGEHRELFLWHWEPMSRSPRKRPHMHVKAAYAIGNTPIGNLHVPTGRILVEDVIRFVIEELGVRPVSPEWETRLADNIKAFDRGKTWDREAPAIELPSD